MHILNNKDKNMPSLSKDIILNPFIKFIFKQFGLIKTLNA